ncbi:MAG TPA: sialidase family protein [Ignavibacteriaceae bacterium]|nr:sialidase family protein [Ignavibacteriaceae bacterium]
MLKLVVTLFVLFPTVIFSQDFPYTHLVTNINDPAIRTNEPSVAVFGNHLIVGTNYNGTNINTVGVFTSSNDGETWTNGTMPAGFNGSSTDDSDPSVSFDAYGNAYFVYLSVYNDSSGIFINKSTDFGMTWLPNSITVITENNNYYLIDKPYIYIKTAEYDNTSNDIFIAYHYNTGNDGTMNINLIVGNSSTLQFTGPYTVASVFTNNNSLQGPVPYFLTSNSSLYVAYEEKLGSQFNIRIARSTNGGKNFSSPVTIASDIQHIGWEYLGNHWMGQGYGFSETHFRVNLFPSITSVEGNLYVAFAEKLEGDNDEIILAKSTDQGVTWVLTDGIFSGAGDEFFPWITSTADGKLAVVYQSMVDVHSTEIYSLLAISLDGFTTVQDPELIDHFNYDESFWNAEEVFIGDYNGITANDNNIFSVFTSNRTVGSNKPTSVKMGIIPNKVNLLFKAYSNDNPSSSEIEINGVPYPIPNNGFIFNNSETFSDNDYFVSGVLTGSKFRHWNGFSSNPFDNPINNYAFPYTPPTNPKPINIYYYPTQPILVKNYLEGGTSTDDFGLSWQQNPDGNYTFDFGESFDAFIYNSNTQDEYSITALPITAQRYNTNWNFLNWNTGSTSTTIQNIKVPDDIPPSGSFTANYKGHFTSAQSDAFTSNGQRKIVLDSQGKYHLVYPSYGKIWSTQSNTTDFNGVWSNEFIFAEESDLQLKNPSIDDFDGYTSATVFEGGMNGFAGVFLAEKYLLNNDSPVITQIPETGIDPNYFGNIKPVVAYTAHEIFVVYKPSSSSPKGIGVNITTAVNG